IESVNTKVSGYSKLKQEFKNAVDVERDIKNANTIPSWWKEEFGEYKDYHFKLLNISSQSFTKAIEKLVYGSPPDGFKGTIGEWKSYVNSLSGEVGFSNWLNTPEGKVAS